MIGPVSRAIKHKKRLVRNRKQKKYGSGQSALWHIMRQKLEWNRMTFDAAFTVYLPDLHMWCSYSTQMSIDYKIEMKLSVGPHFTCKIRRAVFQYIYSDCTPAGTLSCAYLR